MSSAIATVAAIDVPTYNNRIIPFADAKASRLKNPRCCCSCSGTSMTSTTSTTGRRKRRRRRRRGGHVLPNANAALPSANEGDANNESEFVFAAAGEEEDEEEQEEARCEIDKLTRAMENARRNERLGFSPGAGLSSEESAEAAFADLINTSNDANNTKTNTYDFDDDDKDEEFLSQLTKGARMDKNALSRKDTNKGGILGDLLNLGSILLRGGHIEKQKDGRV